MLLVRDVFQAKYGKGDDLVALFREIVGYWQRGQHTVKLHDHRILTDVSGPFFTVVTELVVEDFAAWQQFMADEFAMPDFGDWFARMTGVTESGRREFYTVVV